MSFRVSRRWLLYLLIFLYPFLPVNYYVGPLNYSNFCAVLIVLVFLCLEKTLPFNVTKYIPFFWIFIIVYSVFAFFTNAPLTGMATFVSQFLVSGVIIYTVKSEKAFFKIIDALIFSSFILGIIGIVEALTKQYLFQGALFDIEESFRYGVLRSTVTFGHPINFGMYQAIVAIICFYRLSTDITKRRKRMYQVAYAIAIISMFLSVSRLAMCLFIVVQMILVLQRSLTKFIKYACWTILAFAIAVVFMDVMGLQILDLASDMLEMIFGEILGFQTNVASDIIGMGNRFDLYSWVAEAVKGHEWFGLGVGEVFEHEMYEWFTKTSIEVQYLNIYYQCGIIGVTFLVVSYINVLRFFGKKRNRQFHIQNERNMTFTKMLLVLLIMYYICLLGVQETDLTRLYCMLISLGIAYVRLARSNQNKLEGA